MIEYKHVSRNGVGMYAIYRKIFLQKYEICQNFFVPSCPETFGIKKLKRVAKL